MHFVFQAELKAIVDFVGDIHEFRFVGLLVYSCILEDQGQVKLKADKCLKE